MAKRERVYHIEPTPRIVLELQRLLLAAHISDTVGGVRHMPADHVAMLDFAERWLRIPENSRQTEAGKDALRAAWAVKRHLDKLGWGPPAPPETKAKKPKSKTKSERLRG